MAPGSLDVGGAEAVDQRDREIAEGGQNLWGVASAQAGTVFPKADITHIMGAIFDTPMPTIEVQQALGTRLAGGEGGDEINDLGSGFARLGHGASELSHLRDKRPGGCEIGIHLGTDLDGAHLNASSSAVNGLGLQVACLRISKIRRQVGVERGLIAFDGQDGLGLQLMHEAQELGVGVQGISRTHALPDGQHRQHLLSDRDLIGFLVHTHLPERFLAVMGNEGQQMRSGLLARSRSPQGLAIERERLVARSRRGGLHPASQHALNGAGIQLRQQPAIQRATGGQKEPGTKHAP